MTDQQLKDFILEVVNAPDRLIDGSDDYLAQKYRQFFPTRDSDIQLLAGTLSWFQDPNHPDPNDPFDRKEAGEILCRAVIRELRNRLRAVWLAKYDDVAEWRLFMVQLHIHQVTDAEDLRSRRLYPPSPDTPIEQAVDLVRRSLLMLRTCRNPECTKPFFVASRAQQRLCSDACTSIAQKAHKRQWWAENKASQVRKRQNQHGTGPETMDPSTQVDGANLVVTGGRPVDSDLELRRGATIVRAKSRVPVGESKRTLKRFLQNVVNASQNRDHIRTAYAKFFPSMTRTEQLVARKASHNEFLTPENLRAIKEREKREELEQLQKGLQSIWNADEHHTARWRLFTLQSELERRTHLFRSEELKSLPPDQPIDRAFGFLRRNLHLLRTCSNTSCQTFRLFIASKPGQTHCSTSCTTAVQKQIKTRWWKEKGSQWRKSRHAKKNNSQKAARHVN